MPLPPPPPHFYAIILFYSNSFKKLLFIILSQCCRTETAEPERFLVMEQIWVRIKHKQNTQVKK
jgi:hypothetical protein